jgi:hypothetical protein
MDEQRALRGAGGSRGQTEARSLGPYRVWPFSGIVVCAGCDSRLRAQAARNGSYANYRDTARQRTVACPQGGYRNVRAEVLDADFAALLSRPLPETWRADIAAMRAEMAADTDWDAIDARRARLVSERERLKFQHRNGLMTDADLLREADRIRLALAALPVRGDDVRDEAAQASAGQTIASLASYWAAADPAERAEMVRLVLLPEGLRYDLVRKQIVAVRPRAAFRAPLCLAWDDWRAQADGWLVRNVEPAAVTLLHGAGGAHSSTSMPRT